MSRIPPCSAATVTGSVWETVVFARSMWREKAAPNDPEPQPQTGRSPARVIPPLTRSTLPLVVVLLDSAEPTSVLPVPLASRKIAPQTRIAAPPAAAHRTPQRSAATTRSPATSAAKLEIE